MLYAITLFVHSWLRWLVLAAALWSIVRAVSALKQGAAWTPADERRSRLFVGLVDAQLSLGLLLYLWLSPIVRSAFADMGAAMRSAPLRFFAVEHLTAVLLAVACLHIARARARRAADERARHRIMLKGSCAFLLLVLIGIPWPGLKQARPLMRTAIFEASPKPSHDYELFRLRCASCHGATGAGDGLAASAMQPRPRNLADAAWQNSVSDAALAQAIREGGLAHNLSPNMPPHPDLSSAELTELVRHIRSLRSATQ